MKRLLRLFSPKHHTSEPAIRSVRAFQHQYLNYTDESLRASFHRSRDLFETIAIVVVVASRVLGIAMFDVQIQAAAAMAAGSIAEMQTGEGKTLAAVPAVLWHAKQSQGVHVMTSND